LGAVFTLLSQSARATTTLSVDLSTVLRPVTHAASGSLYGITEKVPLDLTALVAPLQPNVFNNPAADVQQPVGDAIVVAGRVASLGARVSIRLADWFPSWPYQFTTMNDWFDKLGQTVSRKLASNVDNYYGYEIWNEPNGTWTSQMSFNDFWQQSYAKLRALDPGAKIIGPSVSAYDANYLQSFLTFAKANDCVPDIISWHELSGSNLTANFQSYRKLEEQLGIGPLPISINEYSGKNTLNDEGMPGASAPMIAKFERFAIDSACISYWDVAHPGRLGSLLASDTSPNGGWWFYKWYGDMRGNMVTTTPPAPNDAAALDGFANVDASARSASVLFAGVNDGTVTVVVKGFQASAFAGSKVHAVVEHTPWVNRTTAVTATDMLLSADVMIDNDQISVTVMQTKNTDGYRLTLTPMDTGMGAAGAGGVAGGGRSGTGGSRNGVGGALAAGAGGLAVGGGGAMGGAAASMSGGGRDVSGGAIGGVAMSAGETGAGNGGFSRGGVGGIGGAATSAGAGGEPGAGGAITSGAGAGMAELGGGVQGSSGRPATNSGCSCSVERRDTPSSAALFALGAAALVTGRRRARRVQSRALGVVSLAVLVAVAGCGSSQSAPGKSGRAGTGGGLGGAPNGSGGSSQQAGGHGASGGLATSGGSGGTTSGIGGANGSGATSGAGAASGGALTGGAGSSGGGGGTDTGATGGTAIAGGAAGVGAQAGAGGAAGDTTAFWERIGPWNFFNAADGNGPSGTCAEAVADPAQPTTMYVGGQNNSATTGVRKSVDGGKHWTTVVNGLTDHSIRALRLDPAAATTLYAGTPSGVFKTADGAATWSFESSTLAYGEVRRLVATSIAGTATLVAATARGLAYRSFAGGDWSMSAAPAGGVYDLAVASAPPSGSTSVFAALDNGKVYKVTLASSGVTWAATALVANTLTVDPSNPDHVLTTSFPGSGGTDYSILESTDGGATSHSLNTSAAVFYVAFDPHDTSGMTVWTGAESGVRRSTDGGKTSKLVPWNVVSKDGYTANSTQIDVQRILADFPGTSAFCSDQGLVQYDTSSQALASLSGDIRDAIVVSVAASRIDAMTTHVLTTMWDWGPTESWDSGQSWQATTWYGSAYWNGANGKGAPPMGEGGQVFALPSSADGKAHVLMHDGAKTVYLSSDGGFTFSSVTLSANAQNDSFDWARDATGAATGTVYLAIAGNLVQQSTDYGKTWANWGPATWPKTSVAAIAVDPKSADHVFVASGSCLTSTTDAGKTWSACVTPSPKGSTLKRLVIRPDDPTKMLALTTSGELLQSSSSGATWSQVMAAGVTAALNAQNASAALLSYAPNGKLAVLVSSVTARPSVTPHVQSSADDGATWTDITHEIVATQFNNVTWDGDDFYLASSGEAILRRRGLAGP
jgi:hypothetical protein